jgi:hypothetical protein
MAFRRGVRQLNRGVRDGFGYLPAAPARSGAERLRFGVARRRLGLHQGASADTGRIGGNRHAEVKMLGLNSPDTELYRASELSFRDLIRHEAPERITDGSDLWSGVWQIGPQVPDEVQPKKELRRLLARAVFRSFQLITWTRAPTPDDFSR